MAEAAPFHFRTENRLVRLTGLKATTLRALLEHLRAVSGSSIFYHTHHQYLARHFVTPVFYDDFAAWAMEALQEPELAEKLAAIDLLAFTAIRPLRNAIVETIERHLAGNAGRVRECPPGDEFHFCESQSFIMPTGLVARDVEEFFAVLPRVTNVSLFFHFFEARLRLEQPTNDFSAWLGSQGARDLARAIDRLDPYVVTLDELKAQIVALGRDLRRVEHARQPA